jgi:hypothetical protein
MICPRAESSGEINKDFPWIKPADNRRKQGKINQKSACILQAMMLYYHGDFVEMPGELCPYG